MADRKRSNWIVWLGVVAIFVSGAVTGILGAAFYVHHVVGLAHSRGPRAFEDVALELLDWELDLDDGQESAIAEIIADVHLDLIRFKSEHAEEIDGLLDAGLDRIEGTLTEPQRADWRTLRARIETAHRVPGELDPH